MSRRTTTTRGTESPHKHSPAVPGHGATHGNARSINTEQGGHKPKVGAGTPSTYFSNSRAIDTDHHSKD